MYSVPVPRFANHWRSCWAMNSGPLSDRICSGIPRHNITSDNVSMTCRLLGQWRGTQRYEPNPVLDEDALTRAIVALGTQYGRYGYRRITALLRSAGWEVGKDRVQRIWRREGLKVPQKQRSRGRLWLNDGSCVRLRPERANHVWSYDFVSARTHEGKTLRLLTLIDEYTRECLAIRVERRMGSQEVIETLSDVMLWKGIPEHIRSDNGPEFIAQQLRQWLAKLGTATLYIEPGSPWENGYCESFNHHRHAGPVVMESTNGLGRVLPSAAGVSPDELLCRDEASLLDGLALRLVLVQRIGDTRRINRHHL